MGAGEGAGKGGLELVDELPVAGQILEGRQQGRTSLLLLHALVAYYYPDDSLTQKIQNK
jgi:hypothetical protein